MKHLWWVTSLGIVIVVVCLLAISKMSRAEMFPSPPSWFDVNVEQDPLIHVHYFEYKGQACFVANTKYVVNMQCSKL
jgi:hypothetical protein